MKVWGRGRRQEYLEAVQQEGQEAQRPGLRFLLWTGVAGLPLNPVRLAGSKWIGDLGEHRWVVRIECDFVAAPGDYRVEYYCDLEQGYRSGAEVPETEWLLLGVGTAVVVTRLAAGSSPFEPESERPAYHQQTPLLMRYIRVVAGSGAEVNAMRVYPDTAVDLSERLIGTVSWARKTEAHRLGQFVKPSLTVDLANHDGLLNWRQSPAIPPVSGGGLFDAGGRSRLRSFARYTLEVRYSGPGWEAMAGFEGTGWWPVFEGRQRRRGWKRSLETGGRRTELSLEIEAGRQLEQKTTQPLLEQMPPDDFLRERLTMTDDGQRRLCGVAPGLSVPIGTSFEEFVGKTRVFGSNWWEACLTLEPPERIHGISAGGGGLIALTYSPGQNEQGSDISKWWLVRFDWGGKEIERKLVADRYGYTASHGPERRPSRENLLCGMAVWGERIAVGYNYRAWRGMLEDMPFSRGAILLYPLQDWGQIGAVEYGVASGGDRLPVAAGTYFVGGLAALPGFGAWGGGLCAFTRGEGGGLAQFWSAGGSYIAGIAVNLDALPVDWGRRDWWRGIGGDPPLRRVLPRVAAAFGQADSRILLLLSGRADIDPLTAEAIFSEPSAKGVRRMLLDPTAGSLTEVDARSTEWAYSAVAVQGDYVWAAGFGPEAVQRVAKVARLGYWLENQLLLSAGVGDRTVNFGEPRLRLGGEVLQESQHYVLDWTGGHVGLLFLPEDRVELRASYDYRPCFSLVPIADRERWDVAEELCNCFGLTLRVDAVGRLAWGPRVVEERFVAATGRSFRFGSSLRAGGVPWIVVETISVLRDGYRDAVVAGQYSLSSEKFPEREQEKQRWTLTVKGTVAEQSWVIRYVVQQDVPDLGRAATGLEQDMDARRVITKMECVGIRRTAADSPQRIEQVFEVGPADTEFTSLFERMRPVEAGKSFDWVPMERIYEQSSSAEMPRFHIAFNEPLICGSSAWAVEYGDLPLLRADVATMISARFVKVEVAGARHADYAVWLRDPGSFRLATGDDYEDLLGNTVGGAGNEPTSAAEVRTVGKFYLKKMNSLAGTSCYYAVYHSRLRWFRQDSKGRIVAGAGDEQRYSTRYPERRVEVILRPQDVNGAPLLFDDPGELLSGLIDRNELRLQVATVAVTSEGLRIGFKHYAQRRNFLVVTVTGYPAIEAEKYIGAARADAATLELYGELARREEWPFFPNLDYARRAAEQIVLRRGRESELWMVQRPLAALLQEDQLGWLTLEDDSRALVRIIEVTHDAARDGSRTSVTGEVEG